MKIQLNNGIKKDKKIKNFKIKNIFFNSIFCNRTYKEEKEKNNKKGLKKERNELKSKSLVAESKSKLGISKIWQIRKYNRKNLKG